MSRIINGKDTLDQETGLEIAKGNVAGISSVSKFGNAPDFDTTDLKVTIWDGADDAGINQMRYSYSTTANIDTLSSDDNTDKQSIQVVGLDGSYNPVTQNKSLDGTNKVTLTTPLLRAFRMINDGTSNNAGHIYCYVNSATTAGTPNDGSYVRAVIQPTNNQTLMSLYTVPIAKTAYLCCMNGAVAGANKTSNYVMDLVARPFGKVFNLKNRMSASDTGSSYINKQYITPLRFAAKTDIEMRVSAKASGAVGCSFSSGFDIVLVDD